MALIAHWKLDDNAASTTVVATVGTNATLNGGDNTSAKTTTGPGGSITAGLLLNGTDDRIDVSGGSIAFANSAAFSVSLWFKRSGTIARLFGAGVSASDRVLVLNDTTIRLINGAGTTDDVTVPSMGTSDWHHMLMTRTTGNAGRLFLDNVERTSGPPTVDGAFSVGYLGFNGNAYTNGLAIAQVKIFNSDESANVAALYAEGVGGGGGGAARRRRALICGA